MSGRMRRWILLGLLLLTGCARPIVKLIAPPPRLPEDRAEYEQGLRAFREFTPEGYSRAIAHFEKAMAFSPAQCDYALHFAEANLFLAQEQRANYEDFNAALRGGAPPSCGEGTAYLLRLEALAADFALRRDRTPITKIEEAAQFDPNDAMNWLVRWKLNPTSRDNSLTKALEIDPNLAGLYYELGSFELLTGDYLDARGAFQRALELSPRHFRSVIGLAQAISTLDEEADVEPLYKQAVEIAPAFIEGRLLLGDYYSGLEEIGLGREQYVEAIRLNPRFEPSQLRLGVSLLQTGNWDDAERAFRTAIDINPASYEAFYYIGNIWVARGELAQARESYQQSLSFVLNFPDASYALGTVHFREGHLDLAMDEFERVLKVNRRHADAYFSRAAVWGQRGQFSQAIDDYNQALVLYEQLAKEATASIAQYEARGLMKKVEAEKKRKERIEGFMERARQSKSQAEAAVQ